VPEFKVNVNRLDPYKNFKFRVVWDGHAVAGVTKVSGLSRTTEVVRHREGGDTAATRKAPGRTEYDAITLERGITHDTAFEEWANTSQAQAGAAGGSVADFRKEVRIELYDETGKLLRAYNVHRCWVSQYESVADLDANANAVAIEHITLENEGWERDTSV
jgi:phage tail-like protein